MLEQLACSTSEAAVSILGCRMACLSVLTNKEVLAGPACRFYVKALRRMQDSGWDYVVAEKKAFTYGQVSAPSKWFRGHI